MNLYYLTYAGVIHRVDFELSTDTPYDMAKCWQGRTIAHCGIVRDNKRPPDAHPDIITWVGACAAIVGHTSPPIRPPYGVYNDESDIQLAIKTHDGICAIYRHDNRCGLAHVTSQYMHLPDIHMREIRNMPDAGYDGMTTDLYTDELIYKSGAYIMKNEVRLYYVGTYAGNVIGSAGNVSYIIGNGRINMYDDRLGEIQRPITLYESNDMRIARWCHMRMMSDAIMTVGSVYAIDGIGHADMALFDVRSPGRFAAEPPPVILTSTDGVKQIEL